MVDLIPYRVTFSKKMGATNSFLYEAFIKDSKYKNNYDLVFDAAGTQESVDTAFESVAIGGEVCLVGIPTKDYLIYNPHKMRTKEVKIINVRRSNDALEDSMRLFTKNGKVKNLITHKFEMREAKKAFDIVSGYQDNVMKCVINF